VSERRIVEPLPREVREIENCWIPMPDGARLAARIWLPAGAERDPVPAVLEYIPYRKRSGTRERDEPMHRYFAGHGYASVRVDVRGSGESDGVLLDEYTDREQQDGVEVIRWIAAQPWCSGAVGMLGKSWGGFNALQVAALDPPELKAVIAVCGADDRYADDAHYMGGCLLNENLIWGSLLLAVSAQPPDPELVGERWRAQWRERLDALPLFPEVWLRHQRRDAYWKRGSVSEDLARIRCAVYAIGGWADGYTNAVPRLLAGLACPRKGLVGPWAHVYPHDGVPGPAIGFLQEALRWWERWLCGVDNGIEGEPAYRVWMQESVPPRPFHALRPGRWVAEAAWPSPRISPRGFALARGGLVEDGARDGAQETVELRCLQIAGLDAGSWCGFGLDGEAPGDQRADDGRSLTFDSAPLAEHLEILGAPELDLVMTCDRPLGFVAARLADVGPDGSSARVTYGLLNLTHRDGHEEPRPVEPGEPFAVRLRMNDVAHAFPAGHRLRVALSTSYWPLVWPSPEPVTLGVRCGASRLELPVRPPSPEDARLSPFEPPEAARGTPTTPLSHAPVRRFVRQDLTSGETVYSVSIDASEDGRPALERLDAIDLVAGHSVHETFRIHRDDPLSARARVVHRTEQRRGGWRVRVEASTSMTATASHFLLSADLRAWEGGAAFASRSWQRRIPRDGV
jgi:uncharacterized protein